MPAHENLESLCEAYCPPLEAGLVYALASDYDLNDPNSRIELETALDGLKESAVIEQDLELLPQEASIKGTPALTNAVVKQDADEVAGNVSSHQSIPSSLTTTEDDGVTSATTEISGLNVSESDHGEFAPHYGYGDAGIDFETLSDDAKCQWLRNMFPNVKSTDAKQVLVKCKGDFDRSVDELLNLSFLNEGDQDHGDQTYSIPKGVEGFLVDEETMTRKKAKGKAKRNQNREAKNEVSGPFVYDSTASSGTATPNRWKDLPADVEFIASRTSLRPKSITPVYHANGARLAPTIRAFVSQVGDPYLKAHQKIDEIMELQMDELKAEVESASYAQIYGALILANKIPSAAKDLLDAMLVSNQEPVLLGKVMGLASYTPINLSDDEGKSKKIAGSTVPGPTSGISAKYTTSHLANSHGIAATQAFEQASAAYRRGKSDHLMGGAAAYYASIGHDRVKAAKSVQAAAADAHVAAQSSTAVLDLHGVNVSDAVRIAQNQTAVWWDGLGDRKYVVGGRGDGYRIVTGVGRHSSDGIGRIGPAVSKMLVREGWKVEVGRGEIVVSGRAKR